MVLDHTTSTLYQVAGGGHGGYAGNEVEKLVLNVASPAWVQVLAPSTSGNVQEAAYYLDGRPCSRHHYYGLTFDASNSRLMLVGGSRWGASSGILIELDSFNIGSGAYSADNTHPDIATSVNSQEVKSVCRDDRNDNIYVFANFNVAKWTRSTNTWSSPVSDQTAPFFDSQPSAFDSSRNKIAILMGATIEEYDPDGNTFTTRTLTGTSLTATTEDGLQYIPALDVFLVRQNGSGGTVYQINASTFVVSTFTTTGGASVPSTLNGPHHKFRYVPNLSGCIYVPTYTGNAWFLRVH
jgi:hypothetical protein